MIGSHLTCDPLTHWLVTLSSTDSLLFDQILSDIRATDWFPIIFIVTQVERLVLIGVEVSALKPVSELRAWRAAVGGRSPPPGWMPPILRGTDLPSGPRGPLDVGLHRRCLQLCQWPLHPPAQVHRLHLSCPLRRSTNLVFLHREVTCLHQCSHLLHLHLGLPTSFHHSISPTTRLPLLPPYTLPTHRRTTANFSSTATKKWPPSSSMARRCCAFLRLSSSSSRTLWEGCTPCTRNWSGLASNPWFATWSKCGCCVVWVLYSRGSTDASSCALSILTSCTKTAPQPGASKRYSNKHAADIMCMSYKFIFYLISLL